MSKYSAILLTVYGQAMITESASQKKPLIFTRIELGDGALEENESFVEFTKLKDSRLSMNINSITREANATCTIIAAVDNSEVEQGFFTREIGIFAKVGNDGDESLFAYTNAGNYADYTPDKTSTLDEKQIAINLAVGNATSVTAVIGSAQYATLKNLQDHNKDETAHENLIRVKSMSTTDDGINYVTQDNQSHSLNLWNTLKQALTGATAANGDKNTLAQQLDAIAGMIKKITGGAGWYDNPAASIQQLVSMVNSVSAISEYDVDDPNAWWVKLRGEPGLIIQGGAFYESQSATDYRHLPIAWPHLRLKGFGTGIPYHTADTADYSAPWCVFVTDTAFTIGAGQSNYKGDAYMPLVCFGY